jgi:L,D-transpeptidase ErfK/SrfK
MALALLLGVASQRAVAAEREDLVGRLRVAALDNEPVSKVARANDLSTPSVIAVNWGLDTWKPERRKAILLPTAHLIPDGPREGVLINRAEYRIYYFKDGEPVLVSPISVGRAGEETPLGDTSVVRKQKDPTWYPTPEMLQRYPEWPNVVAPGPDNPLGRYALYLGWPTYLIHGTNDDYGIGQPYTSGCIRLFPEDIERLFGETPIGTRVAVVDQPVKLGWHENELFIEAQPDAFQLEELRITTTFTLKKSRDLTDWIRARAGARARDIDWQIVTAVLERRNGIPTQITAVTSHPVNIFEGKMAFHLSVRKDLALQSALSAAEKMEKKRFADEWLKQHEREFPYHY